jgi:RecA/RadA recombinase
MGPVVPTAARTAKAADAPPALGWNEIRGRSLAAVEARLAAFVRAGARGTPITPDAVPAPALGKRFDVGSTQPRRWYDQQFYVVDATLGEGRPEDRLLVTLVRFDKRARRLTFELPDETRKALAGVRSVRVFAVDGMRVRLAEDLRRALRRAERGRLVEALWRPTGPQIRPARARKGSGLDAAQREALGALTRKGAAFVWGPPGSGKTRVITEAVRHALERDRTVLIASHTHVAVDNVLEALVDTTDLEPGDVVRVASPLTEEKVSPRVARHDFLLLRKAVAVVTDEAARRADLDAREAANRSDPARTEDPGPDRAEALAALDDELKEIAEARAELEEELRAARDELLAGAQVVACTLASLCGQRPERRFDVVILDEAASIEPPYVAVAGARADRTFGLVGDFLQNAPIAEAADEEDDSAEDPWLSSDVFALAGIRDRASAEAHPRCVALRRQYRYPSVVADLVNGFCYDGLLESARPSDPADGATVTLVDTSALEERRLVPAFPRSWWCPLGLELLRIIGGHHAARGASVGYVTPYRAQAERAAELSHREGLGIPCGTAHRFQGRQFDIVVVDLMQDDRVRWAGAADLHGDERQASAAKLLNVALTRMRERLYLFADWRFVRGHDTPGMRALAGLEGHPNFKLVDARDVRAWARRAGR